MIQKVIERQKSLMGIAIRFQFKNLMEKDKFKKIVQKSKAVKFQKLKEKQKRKKCLMVPIQIKIIQKIRKIKEALEVYSHLILIKIFK